MQFSHAIAAVPVTIVLVATQAMTQTTPVDPRRIPPTEQLGRLAPFLGEYITTMEQTGRILSGRMELKLVVNGFYIERTNLSATPDGKVNSEIRSMITWDQKLGKYRIWRFVALAPQRQHDGVAWFDGDTFIEEYPIEESPNGQRLLRNRITMPSTNEMRIINEIEFLDGKTSIRGIITAKRTK
jgi:hypothetical protein